MSIIKVDYGTISGGGGTYVEETNPSTSTTYDVTDGTFFMVNTTYGIYNVIAIEGGVVKKIFNSTSAYMTLSFSYSSGTLSINGTSGAVYELYGYYS